MAELPKDTCLQCGQSREEVRANDTYCATVSGYEYEEVDAEWDRHHWRDWSDAELRGYILPEFFEQHRRDSMQDLGYAPCDHTERGHMYPERDDPEWGLKVDQCMECGHTKPADRMARTIQGENNG